jgi:hypothetical protein
VPANTPWVLAEAGPGFTPLKFGLLSAAQVVDDPNPHWQGGVKMNPDPCGPDSSVVVHCVAGGPATGIAKTPTVTGTPMTAAEPFSVYAFTDCAPVGWGDQLTELTARTQRALDRGEGRAVERAFWTGQATVGGTVLPHLAEDTAVMANADGALTVELQSAATVVSGVAVGVLEAMGLLEGALAACYGGEGVIHVPAQAVPYLAHHNLANAQGPQLRTLAGHKVAAYSSNSKEGPTGSAAGAGRAWFYATGAVVARRSPAKPLGVSPGDFVGKADNDTVYIVERTYVIDWDCCHLAVEVLLGGGT